MMIPVNFNKLNEILNKAKKAGVGFSVTFCECDSSWYFSISSTAPSEEWIGRNHSFDIACECVIEWLDSITKP